MSKSSEVAAAYSFASLAADFVLTPAAWPMFLAWMAEDCPDGAAIDPGDKPLAAHLARHLAELAGQANRLANAGLS